MATSTARKTNFAATSSQIRAAAAQNRAAQGDFREGNRVGGAEVGIGANAMRVLVDAMTLSREFDAKLISKEEYGRRKVALVQLLNGIDLNSMSRWSKRTKQLGPRSIATGTVVRNHRPLAYVPFWDTTGRTLVLPNHAQISRRYSKGEATGFKLIPLLGKSHLKMMRFPTRPRVNGKTQWTPGNIRVKASGGQRGVSRGSTKAFGYYMSANGKQVPVTASSTSRLAQLAYNLNGQQGVPRFVPNPAFRPYTDPRSGRSVGMGMFLSPHAGGRGLAPGERVRSVRGTDGGLKYSIGTPSASGSNSAGYRIKGFGPSAATAIARGIRRGDFGAASGASLGRSVVSDIGRRNFGGRFADSTALIDARLDAERQARLRGEFAPARALRANRGAESPSGLGSVMSTPLADDSFMLAENQRLASQVDEGVQDRRVMARVE